MSDQLDKFQRRMIAWKCKICAKNINWPAYNSSCSNLLTHAGQCLRKQQKPPDNKNLATLGVTGTGDIDPREASRMSFFILCISLCALWCAEGAQPFLALEEASLKRVLHPIILKHLPTRKMVSKAIHMLYLSTQEHLCEELRVHKGALYLGVDAWQTPNGFDIIGAVVYRLLDNSAGTVKLDAMPLDFVQLKESHTGEYLARMVQYIVEKFQLKNRICGIVSKNAANNGKMVAELEKLGWKRFKGEPQWIRCFAHILNLIVKAILRLFSRDKKANGQAFEDEDSDEEKEAQDLIEGFDDEEDEISSDEEEVLTDVLEKSNGKLKEDDDLTLADIDDFEDKKDDDVYTSYSCRRSLAKFRTIATKLKKSPNSKAQFIALCQENQCKRPHNVKRDVPTRWNSTYLQLSSIIRCEKAIIMWQRDKRFGTTRSIHVSQEDFDLAADLVQVLKPFYDITLQLSTSGSARVAEVVVMIDQITANLSAVITNKNQSYPPALRNACRAGLKITNKYYSLTDCSPIYRISMVLHPSFKDKYFKLAKWPQSWIDEAIRLTREMYEKWYKPRNLD
ncbi:hypothetical protein PTTG_25552 [Puccinia triticina 1-1 BBBD Race 1]|uniref:DUF659 domain-containing protein n=1 Tax=Puccinia triticina (isolate 1-1 / race 1 (BBBD)) TaxID=630390 RepID=A0A180H303_PUCT1|nr:hypothetical protein PTTG_25552 [Puccinia triticina 1-1 BBBD Race 1]